MTSVKRARASTYDLLRYIRLNYHDDDDDDDDDYYYYYYSNVLLAFFHPVSNLL